MKIGITGGAGYIGSHIVADLLDMQHELIVIDDMSLGNPLNRFDDRKNYTFIEGSLHSDQKLDEFFEFKPEVVFHFASFKAAGESMQFPIKYSQNNIRASFYFIEKMIQKGCNHIIFSSTASVYGHPKYNPLDEKHPLDPINYYGFTKLMVEKNLEWMAKLHGLKYAILRYFNAAGYDIAGRIKGLEKQPNNLLPVVMEVACGKRKQLEVFGRDYDTPDGTGIRDYIHVNDLSLGHIKAMHYILESDKNLVVNLGSQNGLSVQNILDTAKEITGCEIPSIDSARRNGDPATVVSHAKKAKEILGWQTQHSDAKTILESMWKVYKNL